MEHVSKAIGSTIETITRTPEAPDFTRPTSKLEEFFGFKTFGEPILGRMLVETANFCAGMRDDKPPRWLSLLGKTGSGKTHLARQITKYFDHIAKWYEVPGPAGVANCVRDGGFYDWRVIASDLKSGNFGIVDQLCSEWLVILDDVGAEYDPSGFIASALDRVLNSRLKKWTVITSNFTLAQLAEKIDVRIASRMLRNGSRVIEVNATDYNLRG